MTLQRTWLSYITLHGLTLHFMSLPSKRFSTLPFIASHCIISDPILLHHVASHWPHSAPHYTEPHDTTQQYITSHYISLHFITSHFIFLLRCFCPLGRRYHRVKYGLFRKQKSDTNTKCWPSMQHTQKVSLQVLTQGLKLPYRNCPRNPKQHYVCARTQESTCTSANVGIEAVSFSFPRGL